ncbi:MAG: tRNA (5-methylaminomethyl-2-thiouridine)(34)-methyltransferase MnmD [Pseudomonadota bacterium]
MPVSVAWDDAYFAWSDGAAETREVFLGGNGLPARFADRPTFSIGELGFGSGLNCAVTADAWQAWRKHVNAKSTLTFTSFEIAPMSPDDLRRALARWPELLRTMEPVIAQWPPRDNHLSVEIVPGMTATVIVGDASRSVPDWDGEVDAWYLDGFSPSKNPELWELDLMRSIHDQTAVGGTFSTYTAAGWVRRNLGAAGFDVQRVPGFDNKRERLQGIKTSA